MMRSYFVPLFISLLVNFERIESNVIVVDKDELVTHPSLCDTIECSVLFTDSNVLTIKKDLSHPFIYVPSQAVFKVYNINALYESLEYSQIVGDDLDKHLVDKLNQIFDFSLGRMQDIYYDTTGKVGVENMLDWIIENTPYTVYNESGVLIDDSQQVCLDSNGYLTDSKLRGRHCISVVHSNLTHTQEYAGPSVWNRIAFEDTHMTSLRYLLSDGLLSTNNNTQGMFLVPASSCPAGLKIGHCYTIYSLHQYSSVCCCVNGVCPREKALSNFEYAARSKGDVCAIEFSVHHETTKNGTNMILNASLSSYNYAEDDAVSRYIQLAMQRIELPYACFQEMSKPRCPGSKEPDDFTHFHVKCFCESSEMCAVKLPDTLQLLNKGHTIYQDENKKNCYRTLINDKNNVSVECLLYYDIARSMLVNLEENNNFRTIKVIDKYHVSKLAKITAKSIEIFPSIFGSDVNCSDLAVYKPEQTGNKSVNIIYEINCGTSPGCDQYFIENEGILKEKMPDPVCIVWPKNAINLNYTYRRSGPLELEIKEIREKSRLRKSEYNGYCFMEYMLADDSSTEETLTGYTIKTLTTELFFEMECPHFDEENGGEICIMEKQSMYSFRFCCKPLIAVNEAKAKGIYYNDVLGYLKNTVESVTVFDTEKEIHESISKSKFCVVKNMYMDECSPYNGCYRKEIVNKENVTEDSACTANQMAGISLKNTFDSISVCDLRVSEFSLARTFTKECLYIIGEGSNAQFEEISDLSPQYICCCKKESCLHLLPTLKITYNMFLDEDQEVLQNHLPGFDEI